MLKDGSGKQKTISVLVLAGAAVGFIGLVITIASFMIGMSFGVIGGFILIPVGVVMVIVGLASGWTEAFGDPSKKPIQHESYVYIVAKIIADEKSELVIDPEFYDPEVLQHLVQIEFRNGRKVEFKTAVAVFDDIGEGMHGDIVYQGKWLNQFTFRPKEGESHIGEDSYRAGNP